MKSFSLLLVLLSFLLMGYRMFVFFSFDEIQASTQVISSPATRFITRSREDLELLKQSLDELKQVPESFLEGLEKSDFGRKRLFLPDQKKKVLASPSSTSS